jgi:hypothetical protein
MIDLTSQYIIILKLCRCQSWLCFPEYVSSWLLQAFWVFATGSQATLGFTEESSLLTTSSIQDCMHLILRSLTNNDKSCKLVIYGCNTMSTKQIGPWAENKRFGQDCLLELFVVSNYIYTKRGCRGHRWQDQSRWSWLSHKALFVIASSISSFHNGTVLHPATKHAADEQSISNTTQKSYIARKQDLQFLETCLKARWTQGGGTCTKVSNTWDQQKDIISLCKADMHTSERPFWHA